MHTTIRHTIALAARSLLRAPSVTFIAVSTLAIGLASAVALMGMVDAGIRELPVPDGDQVVELEIRNARAERVAAPAPVTDWARGQGIQDAGALQQIQATLVHPDAGAFRLSGAAMDPAVLRLLRVPPVVGRLPSHDVSDANALVIAWSVWQEMGADDALLGATIRVDGVVHTLIGVMPEGFGFPERQSFWTVLPPASGARAVAATDAAATPATGAAARNEIVARIDDDTRIDVATDAVQARVNAVASAAGAAHLPYTVTAERWTTSRDSGGEGTLFGGLAILVALLLFVCAANVATLLMVRGEERGSLLAVHAALGASRLRVGAQLFAEAALIALGGGALGLAGGFALLHWMQLNLSQHWGYYWMTMEVRLPVVLGTVVVVLITTVLAGTAPAVRAMRVDIARMLVSPGRGGADRRRRTLGRWFVGAQVALSTVGLVVAAYLGWGAGQLDHLTERLPMDEVAVASITLPSSEHTNATEREQLVATLRQQLLRINGVRDVAIGTLLPGGGGAVAPLVLPGDDAHAERLTSWDAADAGLAATYDMRLVAGRLLNEDDDANSAPVALITAVTARRYFTGNAVGERIRLDGVHDANEWAEIVGVIEDWVPERSGRASDRVILPLAQVTPTRLTLSVRATDPTAALPEIRNAVARIDRQLPMDELQTLPARMDYFLRMSRVIAAFGVFGGLASALVAAVGLYGVISFQVRSRTREIGVRMAVGAGARRIIGLFVLESMRRVLPGLAIGFVFALFVAPIVGEFVSNGAGAPDALLLGVVFCGMLGIGVVAALEPAARAARLDPQVVLRAE